MRPIKTPRAENRTMVDGEYHRVALVRREHFDAGLSARLLLGPSAQRRQRNPFLCLVIGKFTVIRQQSAEHADKQSGFGSCDRYAQLP